MNTVNFVTLWMVLSLICVARTQGNLFHPSNGYDFVQRNSRPPSTTVNSPFYQRISAAFAALHPAHHDNSDCLINHGQDPDQGEVVQSAAYPHVTVYHPNYQHSQWSPVVYNPVAYPQSLGYPQVSRFRTVHRTPLGIPIPAVPLEGVPSADYGYHHPSAYTQHYY